MRSETFTNRLKFSIKQYPIRWSSCCCMFGLTTSLALSEYPSHPRVYILRTLAQPLRHNSVENNPVRCITQFSKVLHCIISYSTCFIKAVWNSQNIFFIIYSLICIRVCILNLDFLLHLWTHIFGNNIITIGVKHGFQCSACMYLMNVCTI